MNFYLFLLGKSLKLIRKPFDTWTFLFLTEIKLLVFTFVTD